MKYSVIACLGVMALSAVSWGIEANAFLNRVARNHGELMHQVRTDPVVMDRYKRHYGKTRDEVLAFLGALRDGRVTETGPFVVYNVPGTGEIRVRVVTVRRGTRAWVDAAGVPILKGACGNPMTRGTDLGTLDLEAVVRRTLNDAEEMRVVEVPEIEVLAEEMAQRFVVLVPDQPEEVAAIGLIPDEVALIPPVDLPFVTEEIGPIGIIGQAAGLVIGGSALTNLDRGVRQLDVIPPPVPIPEPLSITALAIGLGALALRRRKR